MKFLDNPSLFNPESGYKIMSDHSNSERGISFSELETLSIHDDAAKNFLNQYKTKNYEDFLKYLYLSLDDCIRDLEDNQDKFYDKDEDHITFWLSSMLNRMGYDAQFKRVSGNTDLTIEKKLRNIKLQWIGEAKIYSKKEDLRQGFKQLLTRYSTARKNKDHGGLFVYLKTPRGMESFNTWKEDIKKLPLDYQTKIYDCCTNEECFFTTHEHPKSANDYHIRHMPVFLYFKPEDESGKRSKKYNDSEL